MEITIEMLRRYCAENKVHVYFEGTGVIHHTDNPANVPLELTVDELRERVAAGHGVQLARRENAVFLQAEGYEHLALVLQRAFIQAAHGKGKERHAQGEPFTEQVMQDMARRFGVGALLGQAFKKSEESQRLQHDRAVNELLGAINYLAGAVIAMERAHAMAAPPAANDNPQPEGRRPYSRA